MSLTTTKEFQRVSQMLSGLTLSIPVALMTAERICEIEEGAQHHPELAELEKELQKKLTAVKFPEDHTVMAQAYEAYSEASFWLEMANREVLLRRTPGTGQMNQQRPDFVHEHASGNIYFEVKALEIADPIVRHKELAYEALANAADLDERARTPGVHFGKPLEVSGSLPDLDVVDRIAATIDKITNNVKQGQIYFGPTVLVIDLGRFNTMPYGPSSLLPVFFHDGPPAESCVTGELWQIGLGQVGEQIFSLPAFDGKSNIAGHQKRSGILQEYKGLMAITFVRPRWRQKPELLTLWNKKFDQTVLTGKCAVDEPEVEALLYSYSDGLNDETNELGWSYRVAPLRE